MSRTAHILWLRNTEKFMLCDASDQFCPDDLGTQTWPRYHANLLVYQKLFFSKMVK